MRRFTVPFGFAIAAMWILALIVLVNSGPHTAHH
jgi:hypothetical protein